MPFHASIAVSKAGVEGLAKSLAAEYATKIRFNVISPTVINTTLAARLLKNDKQKEAMKERHPLKKYLEPKEVASLANYLLSDEASAAGSLAKAEVKFSRQQRQLITAERNGTVLSTLSGGGSVFVNNGDAIAVFVPENLKPAAEIFVDGNDLPLVRPGRHVRLQFEGWPAVQFSGWPSVAVGTFGGIVHSVDPSVNKKGKFRVLVVPETDTNWPDSLFLRQGTRVVGWILLDTVRLGYELWRIFNGFPPSMPETNNPLDPHKSRKMKKKNKD